METENTSSSQISKKKSGGVLTLILGLLSVAILVGTLCGGAYYYFVLKPNEKYKDLGMEEIGNIKDADTLIAQIKIKNGQIKVLKDENALLRKQATSVVQKLQYVIKPKQEIVAECYDSKIGKYDLPKTCMQNLIKNLSKLVQSDKRIVALEVSGVVDELPYAGLSPHLKQEGLASFRAKGVIEYLRKNLSNVTVFEGLSVQKDGKRGFFIRAYYVE